MVPTETMPAANILPPPYSSHQLRRYTRYPKLYAERRYPLPSNPSSQPTKPFRLMNLPIELHYIIYTPALTLPFPIEPWPETDNPIAPHQIATANRNMQYLKVKMRQCGVNLNLLRVSRQIRYEATREFYRENECRFSGMNGWMVANAWMFTTRKFGWQYIESITLPLPIQLSTKGQAQQGWGMVRPAVSKHTVARLAKQIPFNVPDEWGYSSSSRDVCVALGKCMNLRVVRLVLPKWCDIEVVDEGVVEEFFGRIEKLREVVGRGLGVEVVRISGERRTIGAALPADERQKKFVKESAERGWEVRTAKCDKFGRLDVEGE